MFEIQSSEIKAFFVAIYNNLNKDKIKTKSFSMEMKSKYFIKFWVCEQIMYAK